MIPGEQCQVDGGELRGVMIGGVETVVYFTVFVLSYSRLMHVSVSHRPIDTDTLIRQHDAAFRYVPLHPAAGGLIHDYQELPEHGSDEAEALFRPLSNNTKSGRGQAITLNGIISS
jgi:hypothetical protein